MLNLNPEKADYTLSTDEEKKTEEETKKVDEETKKTEESHVPSSQKVEPSHHHHHHDGADDEDDDDVHNPHHHTEAWHHDHNLPESKHEAKADDDADQSLLTESGFTDVLKSVLFIVIGFALVIFAAVLYGGCMRFLRQNRIEQNVDEPLIVPADE